MVVLGALEVMPQEVAPVALVVLVALVRNGSRATPIQMVAQ